MKFFALVLAYLAAPTVGVGAAAFSLESARGDVEDNTVPKAMAEIKSAIEEVEQQRRRLGVTVGNSELDGTSCDCSKEAQMEIWTTYKDILDHVSPTFMGLLSHNKELLGDSLGGLEYDPTQDYYKMLPSLKYLVNTAVETLSCMQCGPCEPDSYEGKPVPELYNSSMPFPGISHYECCCDVELIKNIVLKKMKAVVAIVTLNPGAAEFTQTAQESITVITATTIEDIARPYKCDAHECPCFTLADIEFADKEKEFDVCQFTPNRKIVDFDIVLHKKETSFGFCVGTNCPKHCEVDPQSGDCTEEIPEDGNKCYSGIAWLGRPYPYYWIPGKHIVRDVSDEEYEACCGIIEEFCATKGHHPGDDIHGDDIGSDSVYADPDDV